MAKGRQIIRVELEPGVHKRLRDYCEKNGFVQMRLLSKLVEWFMAEPPAIRAAVQGILPDDVGLHVLVKYLGRQGPLTSAEAGLFERMVQTRQALATAAQRIAQAQDGDCVELPEGVTPQMVEPMLAQRQSINQAHDGYEVKPPTWFATQEMINPTSVRGRHHYKALIDGIEEKLAGSQEDESIFITYEQWNALAVIPSASAISGDMREVGGIGIPAKEKAAVRAAIEEYKKSRSNP